MMLQQAVTFAVAAAVLTLLPGSDTLLVIRNTVREGRTAGALTTTGICSALFVHATVSALGMAAILVHVPRGLVFLQGAGAVYLAYLGVRSLVAAFHLRAAPQPASALASPQSRSPWRLLLEGFLANVLNPKAMIFYLAFLPQFLRPGDDVWLTSLALAGIHWIEGMLWLGILILALDRVRVWLLRPRTLAILEGISGILLLAFGIRMAFARL